MILQGPPDDSIAVTKVQLAESGAKQAEMRYK